MLISACVLLGVGLAASAGWQALLRWPDDPLPASVDAIVVLAGAPERIAAGERLAASGLAPTLVISCGSLPGWSELVDDGARDHELLCPTPSELTTQGEVNAVRALATHRGWTRLLVVTSRHHIPRARLLFSRCTDLEISFHGTDVPHWRWTSVRRAGHELGGLAYALLVPHRCEPRADRSGEAGAPTAGPPQERPRTSAS